MKNHYNYNPNKCDLVIGTIKVDDYGEDVKYTVTYENDFRSVITGTDGATITVEHNDRNALISMKILHSSPLNILFSKLATSEVEFPVLVSNRNYSGDIGYFSSTAHFVKIPDLTEEKTPKAREWKLRCINLKPALDLLDNK